MVAIAANSSRLISASDDRPVHGIDGGSGEDRKLARNPISRRLLLEDDVESVFDVPFAALKTGLSGSMETHRNTNFDSVV